MPRYLQIVLQPRISVLTCCSSSSNLLRSFFAKTSASSRLLLCNVVNKRGTEFKLILLSIDSIKSHSSKFWWTCPLMAQKCSRKRIAITQKSLIGTCYSLESIHFNYESLLYNNDKRTWTKRLNWVSVGNLENWIYSNLLLLSLLDCHIS